MYHSKREPMKDYKCFFYQYINTRSFIFLLRNHQLKIFTNVQITISWYQIRMTSLQEGDTQVRVSHKRPSHPTKTFDGSHLLNVSAEQLILNA